MNENTHTRTNGVIEYTHRMIRQAIPNHATHIVRHTLSNGVERFALIFESFMQTETSELKAIADFQLCHVDVYFEGDNIVIRMFANPSEYHGNPFELLHEIRIDMDIPDYSAIGKIALYVADYLNSY